MSEETISLTEAASELGVHYMTVYRHVRTGRLPASRHAGGWLIYRTDLEAYRSRGTVLPVHERQRSIEERLLSGDDAGVWTAVESALAGTMPAAAIVRDLLMPSMQSIGNRWQSGSLSILEEHRASSAMSVVLARLGPHVARAEIKRGTVIIGTPANDTHGLAATMLATFIRAHGFHVVELGAATPAESFAEQCSASDAIAVVISVHHVDDQVPHTLTTTVQAIRRARPDAFVAIGGPSIHRLDTAELGADAIHNDVDALIDQLIQADEAQN